jgi:DNA-binding MarR family transcriptional regulator
MTSPPDSPDAAGGADADHECIVNLMLAIGAALQAAKRPHPAAADADHGGTALVSVLYRCGPMRSSDLAQVTMLDLSTVSRHARALEDAGHVARVADPDDRRAHRLALTESGFALVEEHWNQRLAYLTSRLAAWSREDARTLAELAARFARDVSGAAPLAMPDGESARAAHRAALHGRAEQPLHA